VSALYDHCRLISTASKVVTIQRARNSYITIIVRVFTSLVCLFCAIFKKIDAVNITKLDVEMFHDESWKPIYFGVKRSRSPVTKTLLAWVFALL